MQTTTNPTGKITSVSLLQVADEPAAVAVQLQFIKPLGPINWKVVSEALVAAASDDGLDIPAVLNLLAADDGVDARRKGWLVKWRQPVEPAVAPTGATVEEPGPSEPKVQ